MSSCAFLDPASLLAQSCVKLRLGRRASACSHTPLATARRLPLNESNVQGNAKQASANSSAQTQVLQTIGVEQVSGDCAGCDTAAVHGVLVPRRAGRRRVSVPQEDSTLQLTVGDAADRAIDVLISPLPYGTPENPPSSRALPREATGAQGLHSVAGVLGPGEDILAPVPWPSLSGQGQDGSDGTPVDVPVHEFRPPQPWEPPKPPKPWDLLRPGFHQPEAPHGSSEQQQQHQLPLPSGQHSVADPQLQPYGRSAADDGALYHYSREGANDGPQQQEEGLPWGGQPAGGLLAELYACRSCQSVQRFIRLHRPMLSRSVLGHAVVHLSHLVAEEPPDGQVEWQIVVGLLDDLSRELRPAVGRLHCGQLAAVVCALSRLRFYDGPLLRGVAEVAQQRAAAAELTPRQAAGFLWAYARYHRDFRFQLEPGWATTLLGSVLAKLDTATAKDLSMTLYGMALLGEEPPAVATTPLLEQLRAGLSQCSGQELSMAMWSLASMRIDPGSAWLEAFLARCEEAVRSFARGSAVCNVLYGLAVLGRRPPVPWMRHFLWQAQRRMNTMDAQALSMLAWALGRMRYRPDTRLMKALLRYAAMEMLRPCEAPPPQQQPQQQGRLLGLAMRRAHQQQQQHLQPGIICGGAPRASSDSALLILPSQLAQEQAQGEQVQRATQLQALWREQQRQVRRRLLTGLPGGVARSTMKQQQQHSRQHPHQRLVRQHQHQHPHPQALPAHAYNTLLWACVRLAHRPNTEWLKAFCVTVQPRLDGLSPRELAHMLWCLSRLDWCPHHDWMLDYLFAVRASLSQHRPTDCVTVMQALGRMCRALGYRVPDSSLVDEYFWQLHPHLGRLQTTVLVSVAQAMASIVPPLPPSRLVALLGALHARVRLAAFARQSLEQGAADAGTLPEGNTRAEPAEPPVTPSPPELTPRECVNAVVAVGAIMQRAGRVGHVRQLSGLLLQELLPVLDRRAAELSPVDLLLLLQGVTAAGLGLRHEWLRRHEAQARRCLEAGALKPEHLRSLHRAYEEVGYQPGLLPPPAPGEVEEEKQGPGEGGMAEGGREGVVGEQVATSTGGGAGERKVEEAGKR